MTGPSQNQDTRPLLEVENLVTRFDLRSGLFGRVTGRVHAVENVSFSIARGETLALVGESGCGKSTIARTVMHLDRPVSGSIRFEGEETVGVSSQKLQSFRRHVQMVFQDPFASLNPRMTIARALIDPMLVQGAGGSRAEMRRKAAELLKRVELNETHLDRYPHAFSGGQRQRICIARALALDPKLLIADEAVASLDVTIQAQVINLLMDLQAELGISLLFISHDMAVVERVAHRVAVMYLGEIVEIGDRRSVFGNPQHPYTRKLLGSVPVADPRRRPERRTLMVDEIPSAVRPPDYTPVQRPMHRISDTHFVRAGSHAA
ncbi:ABC transporter ATP-binding protein [Nitratireductor aquimarinus]|uniref:ABC transporter ATP-binding protein n=1 Tax=Nitratireductor TaxID=245876 RepID=UPI0019D40ECF|nr:MULTISPECIES: ATP-binding cassette domain-containing protein [Nitratireductor]MBN7776344.1 ABC transporter ATP-binding protein [Nitratireductor pacificus]MBN7779211.1 ABC transporter ATP-binding protein [Nitratireductor pacificus]MBN7788018.1 ABC transporter ATP-binding protein [Nitratireductor aquimarinus]MBY6098065.1 ATP-binding cassette domain-containing protein [Nitratireductor aquimarinus]MCA1260088.1 ATP-binding cassette domain-containing protein [Nitratireductor aquimarinus]